MRKGFFALLMSIVASAAWAQAGDPAQAAQPPGQTATDPASPPATQPAGQTPDPQTAPPQSQGPAQAVSTTSGSLEIYGFGQADAIVDFRTNNPDWYDVNRPTKLPAFRNEFGHDGHFYLSPRQSRLGAKGTIPTDHGDVYAQFEFDMFGVGRDAGLTTIRLRHAYGEWRHVGGGQTNSQFMDVDVFPNILDYWGPNGMLFFRNVQMYWRFIDDSVWTANVAIENPGASGDAGVLSDRIELQNIRARFPAPDLTGNVKYKGGFGYLRLSGILGRIDYDDVLEDRFDLSGHVTRWGVSVSSNVNATSKDVLRLQYTFGHGIQNYFNDAPVDVGPETNPGNAITPIVGVSLPIQGLSAYLDHSWNKVYSTAAGYARVDIDNSNLQIPAAFKSGQYASVNLLATPVTNVMMGGEFQWARRENFTDGFNVDDYRLQFSFKYSFSGKIGG